MTRPLLGKGVKESILFVLLSMLVTPHNAWNLDCFAMSLLKSFSFWWKLSLTRVTRASSVAWVPVAGVSWHVAVWCRGCLQRRRSHIHTLGQSPSGPQGLTSDIRDQGVSRQWLKWIEASEQSLANIGKSAPIWDCKSPDCCLSRRCVQVNERTISQLKRSDRKIWYLEVNRTFNILDSCCVWWLRSNEHSGIFAISTTVIFEFTIWIFLVVRGYFVNVMMEVEERQSRRDPISMDQALDNANLGKES